MIELVRSVIAIYDEDWRERANCLGLDNELFFTERGDNHTLAEAKLICAGCEVREECLDHALRWNERWGIWGGLSERERRRVRRERLRIA